MIDFIIVGRGLAACVLAHTFHQHQITFKIIGDPGLSRSSLVAAGIWNPIVFKRLTPSWLAHQTIPFLTTFYDGCEKRLHKKFMYQRSIIKPFMQEQEKQLWLKKSRNELEDLLGEVITIENAGLKNCGLPQESGLVRQSGNIDVPAFIHETEHFFHELYVSETFDHTILKHNDISVSYKDIKAKNIIFCEGHLVKNNPFFKKIPLKPAKGEILTIQSEELDLNNAILNKGGFILHTGQNFYKTGATYAWDDLNDQPTQKGLTELESKLKDMISCDYKVVKHEAGVRPSTTDRRPVIGPHPLQKNIFVFNGLGTKGVMLAPYFANNFVLCYLQKQELNPEVNIKRFYHLF